MPAIGDSVLLASGVAVAAGGTHYLTPPESSAGAFGFAPLTVTVGGSTIDTVTLVFQAQSPATGLWVDISGATFEMATGYDGELIVAPNTITSGHIKTVLGGVWRMKFSSVSDPYTLTVRCYPIW